jgi:peptidoglycan/LPS O-acetylase OafA/YrhL
MATWRMARGRSLLRAVGLPDHNAAARRACEEGPDPIGAFYLRRARRLVPALAALLTTYLVINAVRGTNALELVARWGFYTANVYEAFWPGIADHHVGLNHL